MKPRIPVVGDGPTIATRRTVVILNLAASCDPADLGLRRAGCHRRRDPRLSSSPRYAGLFRQHIHHKLSSLRASITSELVLDDVRLPDDALLPEVKGLKARCHACRRHATASSAVRMGRRALGVAGRAGLCHQRPNSNRPIAGFS